MSVDIKERVDVVVSLGTQPISTASFDSAMFLADTESAGWPVAFTEDYRVFTSSGLIKLPSLPLVSSVSVNKVNTSLP